MALEFCILEGSGNSHEDYSEDKISFEEDEYNSLVTLAQTARLPIFAGMDNYYGEYKVFPSNIESYTKEIQTLIPLVPNDLQDKLSMLIEMLSKAKSDNLPIATFPD
jgi:hypothetical protein